MIRRGKRFVRRRLPHTEVTVIQRGGGQVRYLMHGRRPTELTISVQSFKEIYRKVRK